MIDMKRLDARRRVRFGDYVDYVGDFGSTYVGLIVDVTAHDHVVVAKPRTRDFLFDPRQLKVARAR